MPLETVAFSVAGKDLPHTACKLSASAEEAVRTASFTVPWTGPGVPCEPDDEATIKVSGDLWGTGFVRDVRCSHGRDSREYEVTFVSRTCDATECSIDHPSWIKQDADLAAVAEEFDTLGVGIEVDAETARKAIHKVVPGESLFSTLRPDAVAQGVMIHDTPEGKLRLTDKPEGRHAGALKLGENILEASSSLSGAEAVDSVRIKGQASEGTGGPALRQQAKARGSARRRRPRIMVLEGEATIEGLKKRASWEARRAAGSGATASVTVAGFRDAGGRLWTRNYLVAVDDDWIGLQQDMIVSAVSLEQDSSSGTRTVLTLKDPRALGGENPRGKSKKAWTAPEPERSVTTSVGEVSGIVGIDY